MVLPPHVLEEMLKRQRSRRSERPQPRLYIEIEQPMPTERPHVERSLEPAAPERGVVVIDLLGE